MRCERCAGLVIVEAFSAGASSIGGRTYGEWRCVNCGARGLSGLTEADAVIRSVVGNETIGPRRRAPNTESRRSLPPLR
jgi:hypothetical protein